MEFKGTRGKWKSDSFSGVWLNSDYKICDCECERKIDNDKEREYNALLISNAPEFLEEIQDTIDDLKLLKSTILDASKTNMKLESVVEVIQNWIDRKKQLIKEATEI